MIQIEPEYTFVVGSNERTQELFILTGHPHAFRIAVFMSVRICTRICGARSC